jgi:hypothetical protein
MAVLVEAISVVVRVDTIGDRYPGGWLAFEKDVPNQTLCCDNELARVGFMNPKDCRSFVDRLEAVGIIHLKNGNSQDVVVVDQCKGLRRHVIGPNSDESTSSLVDRFLRFS